MSLRLRAIAKRNVCCLGGFFSLVAFMAGQAAAMFDETMPDTIPAEIIADWESQDGTSGTMTPSQYYVAIKAIVDNSLTSTYKEKITNDSTKATYLKACHLRRVVRFKQYPDQLQNILYARHDDLSGSGAIDDTLTTRNGALLVLNFQNFYPKPKVLLSDSVGLIKDPCVSMSGNKVVFAWSKNGGGFNIYEMIMSMPDSIRQLTSNPAGHVVSDFEPCYLPNGDIVFNSTRCFGQVPTTGKLMTNLYYMNKDGKYLRKMTYDMANTFSPTVMSDASVLYSRWEFNDRNNFTCFGLFKMNLDGAHQTEYFGNQISWPVSIYQGREIPNSGKKIMAIIGGQVGPYNGDLVIINPIIDRNSINAVNLVAPKRSNPSTFDLVKGIPDSARHFQNPYPLDDTWFLISCRKNVVSDKFKIYLMNVNGKRELLAWDSKQSLSQQQPIYPQSYKLPAYQTDYAKTTANIKMLNAYFGLGMDTTVKKPSIKKIRVIALDYLVGPAIGKTGSDSLYSLTPVARWKGSWSAKRIVGESKIETDGSANFYAPPRTPLYFQLIDSTGCLIQTMRSWTTLQPGEKYECYGCHENKNESPPPVRPIALNAVQLDSFYGMMNEYLSYAKHIQPILTAKCTPCHIEYDSGGINLKDEKIWTGDLTDPFNKQAERFWCKSYLTLTDSAKNLVNYPDIYSPAEGLKPNAIGSGKSKLITRLQEGMHGATLTEAEMAKLCAWIDLGIPHSGMYTDDMKEEDATKYTTQLKIRQAMDSLEKVNIAAFVSDSQYKFYTAIGENPNHTVSLVKNPLLKVRFSAPMHRLSILVPSEGMLLLVDLRGRRIMSANVSRQDFLSRPERSFYLRAPAGLYIVKFKGSKGSAERAIPLL